MTSVAEGMASALVRLALDNNNPMAFDYAMRIVDDMTPGEKTALIRLQASLTARMIQRGGRENRDSLVAVYERGI